MDLRSYIKKVIGLELRKQKIIYKGRVILRTKI